MAEYRIEFPDYFEDEAWIIEDKGVFDDLTIVAGRRRLRPTFFDPVRLTQGFEKGFYKFGYVAIGALVVLPAVTRENIERSVEQMSRSDFRKLLDPLGET